MAKDKKKPKKEQQDPQAKKQQASTRSNTIPDFTKSESSDYKVKYDF